MYYLADINTYLTVNVNSLSLARGRFDNAASKEAALEDRGKLTLENEFLKKVVQRGILTLPKKSDVSLLNIVTSSKARKGGVNL